MTPAEYGPGLRHGERVRGLAVLLGVSLLCTAGALEAQGDSGGVSRAEALLREGLAERGRGHLARAVQVFQAGLESDSLHLNLWVELAVTQSWRGDLEAADHAYARAQAIDPGSLAAVLGLARVAAWRGDHDRAARLYRTLLGRSDGRGPAHAGLGDLAAVRLDRAEAERHYHLALEAEPSNQDARAGLERVRRLERGRWWITLGKSDVRPGSHQWSTEAGLTYQLERRWSLLGAYGGQTEDSRIRAVQNRAESAGMAWRHAARVGLVWRPGDGVALGGALSVARRAEGWARFATVEFDAPLAAGVRLGTGARPGHLPGRQREMLTWVSLSSPPTPAGVITAQVFRAHDSEGRRSVALAGRLAGRWEGGVAYQVALAQGWTGGPGFRELHIDGTVLRKPFRGMTVGMTWFEGVFRLSRLDLGISRDW